MPFRPPITLPHAGRGHEEERSTARGPTRSSCVAGPPAASQRARAFAQRLGTRWPSSTSGGEKANVDEVMQIIGECAARQR